MKKLTAILLVLALAIGLFTAAQAEAEKEVFTWQLERVIQGGETYWAKDINKLYLDLDKEGGGARFSNLYREEEETPEFSWGVTEELSLVTVSSSIACRYAFDLLLPRLLFSSEDVSCCSGGAGVTSLAGVGASSSGGGVAVACFFLA